MPPITAATITMTMMNVVSADICRAQNFATPGHVISSRMNRSLTQSAGPQADGPGRLLLPTYFVSLEGINWRRSIHLLHRSPSMVQHPAAGCVSKCAGRTIVSTEECVELWKDDRFIARYSTES